MKKIFSQKCVCKYFALDSVVIFPKLLLAKLFLTNLLGAPFQQMTFRQFLPQPPGLDLSERYFVQNKKFVIQLRRHRRIPFPNRRLPFVFFLSFLSFSPPSLPFPLNRCLYFRLFRNTEGYSLGITESWGCWVFLLPCWIETTKSLKTLSRHIGLLSRIFHVCIPINTYMANITVFLKHQQEIDSICHLSR